MTQLKMKIKKGDTVKILSGKDKGKTGTVLRAIPTIGKVVVDNANMHTKFQKSRRAGTPGQKIVFAGAMHVSKVMLIDSNSGKPTRVGYQTLENGTKQRIARKSGKAV
ncbi:MAG TPA: 50S ribosomal protein L24 [Patescibacteria group bacterium]|jgi:large subunit ribosomal protein L24|nr:50S ribosomal protein L24 [Patescibacteria group bacterium]